MVHQDPHFGTDGVPSHRTTYPLSLAVPLVGLLLASGFAETISVSPRPAPQHDSPFRIADLDVGDQAWGLNAITVNVKNTTAEQQPFWMHVGGR